MSRASLALAAALLSSSCAAPSVETPAAAPVAPLPIPQPPAGLPKPYAGAAIQPTTAEEQQYARYLGSTTLLPDPSLCDRHLSEQMQRLAKPETVKRDWVTKPFLAWGGIWRVGAVVGPVEHLYAITEAHVTWQDLQGLDRKSTFSCYVQYARQRETAIWHAGHLKYGAYLNDGHKKYASGPAIPFGAAPPGPDTGWEPGIRYYRTE